MMTETAQTLRAKSPGRPDRPGSDAYLYVSGLAKALELRLIDQARLNRLLDATDPDDISRVLLESGYPARTGPEDMLQAENAGLLEWLQQQMPDPGFAAALISFHDGHNLKLVVKQLLGTWLPGQSGKGGPPGDDTLEKILEAGSSPAGSGLPEFGTADGIPPPGKVLTFAQAPAHVPPADLYHLIAEHRLAELPEWIGRAALEAFQCYLQRYDLGDVDLLIDQQTWQQAHQSAAGTGSRFFQDWLRRKADLVNLDLLMRTRILRSGRSTLARALLPGGFVAAADVLALYDESDEAVQASYAGTPYAKLAEFCGLYAKPGQAARFGRLTDNLLLAWLRDARWVVSGPEVPLAWVLARQAEIKNVRIILTGLRNSLPRSMTQDLMRDIYLAWR